MAIVQSLVTLPQCYSNQDYHWSVGTHSVSYWLKLFYRRQLYSGDYLFICHVFEQLISTYVELRFNVSFCRNAVHATMARSETLGQDQHEACGSNG